MNQRRRHDLARQAQRAVLNVREYTGLFGCESRDHGQPMRIQIVQKLFRSAQYCYSSAGCGVRKSPLTETRLGEDEMAKFKLRAKSRLAFRDHRPIPAELPILALRLIATPKRARHRERG
jgi:hypothetical protein